MAPVTSFAVKEKYEYLEGFGNYHNSEAVPGANPRVNNSPQKPPYGLRTERISGTSFTAPREQTLQTWMYRIRSSLDHDHFIEHGEVQSVSTKLSPNAYLWPAYPIEGQVDWTQQKLLARNGDPSVKTGVALWLFNLNKDMESHTAFSSLDGDTLIIPQAGALDIQTELGRLLVRQNEIAVIPRGLRYRVTLPAGPTRGYICELYQGHFQLPNLGAVGSTGLANVRDFQVPTAFFDGKIVGDVAQADDVGEWNVTSRLNGLMWTCKQDHTPFDVVAWHGTNYPYKYDLARFCVMGNLLFDEHDPSLFVVLTAPAHREPGTAVVDFAIVSTRYMVAEDSLWLPYFHRNTMSEFYGPIVSSQDPDHPLNSKDIDGFSPFVAGLNGGMVPHGAGEDEFQRASKAELKPTKVQDEGMSIFLLETEVPLFLSDWAEQNAIKNPASRPKKQAMKL